MRHGVPPPLSCTSGQLRDLIDRTIKRGGDLSDAADRATPTALLKLRDVRDGQAGTVGEFSLGQRSLETADAQRLSPDAHRTLTIHH
ncbi:MAG: hypothetical protein KatS3mg015_2912 [Fimbriimonadales bacterium]|nr:MAG: hypothetical protein KatS3mg015_2912 [Fimbriimonadales bacterium]